MLHCFTAALCCYAHFIRRTAKQLGQRCCYCSACLTPHLLMLQGLDWDVGAIGNAAWTGVRLSDVLKVTFQPRLRPQELAVAVD